MIPVRLRLVLVVLLPAIAGAQAAREFKDVVYATVDGKRLGLDVYVPSGVTSPALIVWVHGGAWTTGTKAQAPTVFVNNGFALASLDFRQSTEARFPAQVHDIKAAIRFLRASAATYGYRTDRIAIAGSSSGGHLAALVGVTNGHPELEGTVGVHLKESSAVQAILDYYGASDFHTILAQSTPFGLNMRRPALERLLGAVPDEAKALATLASPVAHVDRGDPPLHLLHGDRDPQMPINQSHESRRRVQEIGSRRVVRCGLRSRARRGVIPGRRIPGPCAGLPEAHAPSVAAAFRASPPGNVRYGRLFLPEEFMRIAAGKCVALLSIVLLGGVFVSAQGPATPPPAGQGPGPGAGGRQAGPPQNMKVLPKDWSRQQVQQLMQTFVESLGVAPPAGDGCGHCHSVDPNAPPPPPGRGPQMDFALDTNEKKDVARKMIQLTMAANADYLKDVGDATKKEKVTCYTCHHGEKTPALMPAAGWARGNFTLIPPGPTVPARGGGAGGRGGPAGGAPPAAPGN